VTTRCNLLYRRCRGVNRCHHHRSDGRRIAHAVRLHRALGINRACDRIRVWLVVVAATLRCSAPRECSLTCPVRFPSSTRLSLTRHVGRAGMTSNRDWGVGPRPRSLPLRAAGSAGEECDKTWRSPHDWRGTYVDLRIQTGVHRASRPGERGMCLHEHRVENITMHTAFLRPELIRVGSTYPDAGQASELPYGAPSHAPCVPARTPSVAEDSVGTGCNTEVTARSCATPGDRSPCWNFRWETA
jgi:hypothetical protein